MTRQQSYIGNLEGQDLKAAIETARKINPRVRRLYIDAENNNLRFITHKRVGDSILDVVVHEVSVVEDDIDKAAHSVRLPYKGHQFCLSIDAYEDCCRARALRNKTDLVYTGVLGVRDSGIFGPSVACPI